MSRQNSNYRRFQQSHQGAKAKNQKLHFEKRFRERVGEPLNKDLRDRWVECIKRGTPYQPLTQDYAANEVVILDRDIKGKKTLYTVVYKGRRWVLMWDMIRKLLVTIYPYDPMQFPGWNTYRERKQAEYEQRERDRIADEREANRILKHAGRIAAAHPAVKRGIEQLGATGAGPGDSAGPGGGVDCFGPSKTNDGWPGHSVGSESTCSRSAIDASPEDDRRLLGPVGELGRF